MPEASVDFYDESHGGVAIQLVPDRDTATGPEVMNFTSTLLFACFALRQMRNLGKSNTTQTLGWNVKTFLPTAVAKVGPRVDQQSGEVVALEHHVLYEVAVDMGMSPDVARQKFGDPLVLVPHRGPGARRFVGKLRDSASRPTFLLEAKGFGLGGLLGVGIPQYATDSVILLLAHLTHSNIEDRPYLEALEQTARDCADAFSDDRVTALNLEGLALEIVSSRLSLGSP